MNAGEQLVAAPVREIHLREHWRTIWIRRWVVAAVFSAVVGLVLLYSFTATPVYEATATVEVQPQARRVSPGQDASGLGAGGYGWFEEQKYQNTQIEVVKSRSVAEQAFHTLALENDARFTKSRDPIALFQRQVRVAPRRETGLLDISIRGNDRDEVTRWANVVADAFVARNLEKASQNATQAVASIESMLAPLRKKLQDLEDKRLETLKDTKIYSAEGQQAIVQQRLSDLNKNLDTAVVEVARLKSLLDKIQQIQDNDGDPISIPELAKDQVLQTLSAERFAVEKEFEATKVTFRPGAREYQEADSKVRKVHQRIWDEVGINLDRIRNQYELAKTGEATLRTDIEDAKREALEVGVASSKYDVERTNATMTKNLYDAITKTLNEVTASSQLLANNVQLLDHAVPPVAPVSPNKRLNLFLGALAGMFLAMATAFFLDYLDNTFHKPEQIEEVLHLNTVAVVPRTDPDKVASMAVREAYQTLRTSLIFLSKNRERKVVLLTSTAPQEGKSSTAAQLARALSSAGERVLLVDCDLRRPTQHVHFNVRRDQGVTDFLASAKPFMNWRAFLKSGGNDALQVMTCGPIPPNPPELLGSDRFKRFLDEARAAFDWILIDSPPAASISDASVLASVADLVLLVVRHNHTDRDVVARTVEQLRRVGANVAGVVLNNVDMRKAFTKDYYYAGYYTSEGGEDKRSRRREPSSDAEAGAAR